MDDWLLAMDEGMYTGALFVDLRKAFDVVDHKELLKKLSAIGINGVALQWFKNYLSDRRIVTMVNDTLSNEKVLTHGVPQGSLLGPLLFVIFINDISSVFRSHLYADDTVIYYSDKNVNVIKSVLNTELQVLDKYPFIQNKLLVNYDKTVSMLLGTRHMLSKCDALKATR